MGAGSGSRIVLITGGASGIGEAAARAFAQEGAMVCIADLNGEHGEALAAELAGFYVKTDVTDPAQVEAAVSAVVSKYGRLDVMVNSAGVIGSVGSILEISSKDWSRTLAILLDGVFYGTQFAGRIMKAQRSGVILNLGSISCFHGGHGAHAYTVAKHGVLGLTRSSACELAQYGVRVNAVAPGMTVTPLTIQLRISEEQALSDAKIMSPLSSATMPADIANALVFLASDKARQITGEVITIDSGITAFGKQVPAFQTRRPEFMGA